jgi:biotin transport system substrate-specific component
MNATLMMDEVFPKTQAPAWAQSLAMSLFIALCAQIVIPLPFTPVPITGSTLGVLYTGALLGSRRGALSVVFYLVLGAIGLPFFSGGAGGASHFLGATGGYLVGFLPAAWVCGKFAERGWDRKPFTAAAMMLLSSSIIFAFGLAGLSRFVPAGELLAKGLYPFLPGDVAKACLSAALLPFGWRCLGSRKS